MQDEKIQGFVVGHLHVTTRSVDRLNAQAAVRFNRFAFRSRHKGKKIKGIKAL